MLNDSKMEMERLRLLFVQIKLLFYNCGQNTETQAWKKSMREKNLYDLRPLYCKYLHKKRSYFFIGTHVWKRRSILKDLKG